MAEQIYKNFIDGDWVSSVTGKTFQDVNPADCEEAIGYFQSSSIEDVRNAVQAAECSFKMWKSTLPSPKSRIFFKAIDIMREKREELAKTITLEQGKTLNEARKEVDSTISDTEFLAGEVFRISGKTLTSEKADTFTYYIRQPLGVVSVITPWNYPLAIPNWKIVPALILGNTVIFKPASSTPLIALKYAEILDRAGIPKGVLNLITGKGSLLGEELVTNPSIKGISFTGSTAIGSKLNEIASKYGKKFQAELGGKNAAIIMEDADMNLVFKDIHSATFGVAGQKCTATSRIIIHHSRRSEFVERLLNHVKTIKVGNGLNHDITMGPLTEEKQMKFVFDYIEIGKKEGATLLSGGNRLLNGDCKKGWFVEPTVFTDVTPNMRIAREEIFGPVLCVISVRSFEEAMNILNNIEYGLSATIYTNNLKYSQRFINESQVGITHVNISTNYIEPAAPFGGIKKSGIGPKERGVSAIDFFTDQKVVYIRH